MKSEETTLIKKSNDGIPNVMNSLYEGIKFILKRWWIFVIAALLAGIAGFFYAGTQKPNYKSHLTFALDEGNNDVSNLMSIASQFGINFGNSASIFSGDNITDILKSRRMVERVFLSVDTFNTKPYTLIEYYLLISNYRKNNSKTADIHFPPGQLRNTFTYQQDSLLFTTYQNFAKNKISADKPDRKVSIYEVSVTSPDEKFTKDFTDRLVSETNNFYTELRTKKAKETLEILEERTATMKGNLNSSISNKAAIQDENTNPAFSAAQVPVQKQQANIQVYGAAYGEMFKNLELARFQYLNAIPLMQIIDAANYPMEKIKLSRLKTAIICAIAVCFLILFIYWLKRVIILSRNNKEEYVTDNTSRL